MLIGIGLKLQLGSSDATANDHLSYHVSSAELCAGVKPSCGLESLSQLESCSETGRDTSLAALTRTSNPRILAICNSRAQSSPKSISAEYLFFFSTVKTINTYLHVKMVSYHPQTNRANTQCSQPYRPNISMQ